MPTISNQFTVNFHMKERWFSIYKRLQLTFRRESDFFINSCKLLKTLKLIEDAINLGDFVLFSILEQILIVCALNSFFSSMRKSRIIRSVSPHYTAHAGKKYVDLANSRNFTFTCDFAASLRPFTCICNDEAI